MERNECMCGNGDGRGRGRGRGKGTDGRESGVLQKHGELDQLSVWTVAHRERMSEILWITQNLTTTYKGTERNTRAIKVEKGI